MQYRLIIRGFKRTALWFSFEGQLQRTARKKDFSDEAVFIVGLWISLILLCVGLLLSIIILEGLVSLERATKLYALLVIMEGWAILQAFLGDIFIALTQYAAERKKTYRIYRAPGRRLLLVVEFLYSARTVQETFIPIIADWHLEYFEALKQRRQYKAHWISFKWRLRFVEAMGLSKILSLLKGLRGL